MLKKSITYTDYNGLERTEEFYFNLNEAEVRELDIESYGLRDYLKILMAKQDIREMFRMFKKIILLSYGEKSPDGKRFMKSEELRQAFEQSEAYNALLNELIDGTDIAVADFMTAVLPKPDPKDAGGIIPMPTTQPK